MISQWHNIFQTGRTTPPHVVQFSWRIILKCLELNLHLEMGIWCGIEVITWDICMLCHNALCEYVATLFAIRSLLMSPQEDSRWWKRYLVLATYIRGMDSFPGTRFYSRWILAATARAWGINKQMKNLHFFFLWPSSLSIFQIKVKKNWCFISSPYASSVWGKWITNCILCLWFAMI